MHMMTMWVAESQAGVRPVTGRPERPGLPGRPARSDKLTLLINLLKIHGEPQNITILLNNLLKIYS